MYLYVLFTGSISTFAPLCTLLQCLYYVFRLLFRIYLHNKPLAINVFVRAVYRQYINCYHNFMRHVRLR